VSDVVTVVAGLPRSGSSLMMRMLDVAGIPPTARAARGSYEDPRVMRLPEHARWFDACRGHSVKILDPHRHQPPTGFTYRAVFMERDSEQQARSQLKFLRLVAGVPLTGSPRAEIRRLAKSIERDTPIALRAMKSRGPVLRVRFELLIQAPAVVAAAVADFLECRDAAPAMAACVRSRSSDCLPGLLELSVLDELQGVEGLRR
jgi:hypothetical protein